MDAILLFAAKCFVFFKMLEFVLAGFIVIATFIFVIVVFCVCNKNLKD